MTPFWRALVAWHRRFSTVQRLAQLAVATLGFRTWLTVWSEGWVAAPKRNSVPFLSFAFRTSPRVSAKVPTKSAVRLLHCASSCLLLSAGLLSAKAVARSKKFARWVAQLRPYLLSTFRFPSWVKAKGVMRSEIALWCRTNTIWSSGPNICDAVYLAPSCSFSLPLSPPLPPAHFLSISTAADQWAIFCHVWNGKSA